ncbi:MAG: glutamate--tRNA ligase [Erysipelotrichaceae bacterium]
MKKVRVRYAPSPTGFLHIGNARTAMFNYLFAKHHHGDFVLRIEDTDIERNVEGGEESQLKYLEWLGITPDESAQKPGNCGPYRQMERLDIYKGVVDEMLEKGLAYKCFCTQEELAQVKETQEVSGQAPMYNRHCLNLSAQEVKEKEAAGLPYVIRVRVPEHKVYEFNDMIRGNISFESKDIGDWVIVKSNGIPTYNFAVVVDDHMMDITHVFRGEEHISNTPKQLMIYDMMNWEAPTFAHMTLIVNENHKKLSKRDNSIMQYISQYDESGYLPEAMFNFMALLGWSPEGEEEIFTKDQLIEMFDEHRLSKSPSVFDVEKLRWMNGIYIRNMNLDTFYGHALPYLKDAIHSDVDLKEVAHVIQQRVETFSEIKDSIDFIDVLPDYNCEMYLHKKMKTTYESSLKALEIAYPIMENDITDWKNQEMIHEKLLAIAGAHEMKNGQVLWPIRTALSGKAFTPGGAIEIAYLIGKDESLRRMKIGMEKLQAHIASQAS